jgi:hypothetical protein
MKTHGFSLLLLFLLFCNACMNEEQPKAFRVQIALDSTFEYCIAGYPKFFNARGSFQEKTKYDSLSKTLFLTWDSIAPGPYKFEMPVLFGQFQKLDFDLESDTIFHLSLKEYLQRVDSFSLMDLKTADSIIIAYTNRGCFNSYYEKSTIAKIGETNEYRLKAHSGRSFYEGEKLFNVERTVSDSIVKAINNMVFNSRDYQYLASNSTNYECVHIVLGKKIYTFSDGVAEWKQTKNDANGQIQFSFVSRDGLYGKFKKEYIYVPSEDR